MDRTKIGFVGAGYMSQMAHLPNFSQIPECEIVALAELRPQLREKVADKFGIPKRYSSHKELAEDEEIEAVVALLPWVLNKEVSTYLLAKKKSVMIEKPMAVSSEEAREMVETAKANEVILMVGYMKRYDPGVEMAKKLIQEFLQEGTLGKITFVRVHIFGGEWICNVGVPITTDEPYPPLEVKSPSWLPSHLHNFYHEFINVASHNINLLRFLLEGDWRVEGAFFKENNLLATLSLGDVLCSFEYGRLPAHKWDEDLTIYFQRGWIKVTTPPPLLKNVPAEVEIYRCGEEPQFLRPIAPWGWSFQREAEHFIHCLREKRQPTSSGEDSLRDMLLMEEIFRKLI